MVNSKNVVVCLKCYKSYSDADEDCPHCGSDRNHPVGGDCPCGSDVPMHQCCFDSEQEWAEQFESPDDDRIQ